MRKILGVIICALICSMSMAQETNDVNTPLHLMQPDWKGLQYEISDTDSVKVNIDRVIGYLEHTMPIEVENGRLKQGSFRLTSYEMGVLYAAVQESYKNTGDSRYFTFVKDRLLTMAELAPVIRDSLQKNQNYDRQMRPLVFPHSLDDAGAMCSAYCRLSLTSELQASEKDEAALKYVIDGYMARIQKIYRIGNDRIYAREFPHHNSVWLDDMYMGIPALAWYGALTNQPKYLDEAVNQIRAFKSRMWVQLPSTTGAEQGLFRHGWVEEMNPHPFFPWGRANGWAILTLCEVLDAMKVSGYNVGRDEVLSLLQQHIEGLCNLQDQTGLWHQLLNDNSSFLETSASAIFTYCIAHAICEGWVDSIAYGSQALLGWNAISGKINSQGQVLGTVVGSGMGFDKAFYCHRPCHPMAAHGYGPMIWAGSEIIRMLRQTHPKKNDSAIHFYKTEQTAKTPIFSEKR